MRNGQREGYAVRARRVVACAAAAWIVALVAGCAPVFQACPPGTTAPLAAEKPENGWWYASFQFRWPEGEEPSLHTDLIVAHRIAAPILARHNSEIPLWRFHRRAARDEAGHRFSLILYCPPKTARRVFAAIDSSIVLEDMKTAGLVLKVRFDDASKVFRPGVEDVSDKSWSKPLQKSWPYFIMGVSETWLDLIDRFANDGRPKPFTLEGTVEFYRGIDAAVRETWAKEGAHAFLHHLNALFGYGPVTVYGKHQMRF
ncbi:MAG: hypothetical protein WAW37_08800 [Syntrophobacteraceae bacterium]